MAATYSYTVSQLARRVDSLLAGIGAQGRVLVTGEIAEPWFRRSAYGPIAGFTLTEGGESLTCISYGRALASLLARDGLTGECFDPPRKPEEVIIAGREVLCDGEIHAYAKKGKSLYQLVFMGVTDLAQGRRDMELRRLKAKLAKEGFFKEERKRPVPLNPSRVALVTSTQGAVIHDFLQNARHRGLGCRIRIFPVRVQGDEAPADIVKAIEAANQDPSLQCIVLIRGGGSVQDLACFDDERVARAVFESRLPVVAGIGHEVDTSLADMTADLRASTPTQAAQLLWEPRAELGARANEAFARARGAFARLLSRQSGELSSLGRQLRLVSPQVKTARQARDLAELSARLHRGLGARIQAASKEASTLALRAGRALDLAFSQGCGRLAEARRRLARAPQALILPKAREAGSLALRLHRGLARAVQQEQGSLAGMMRLLKASGKALSEDREHALEALRLRLEAASPQRVLERGFAAVADGEGRLLRSVALLKAGQEVRVRMADGSFLAVVRDVVPAAGTGVAAGAGSARQSGASAASADGRA